MQSNGEMAKVLLRANSKLFIVMLAVSGAASVLAYFLLFFFELNPATWFLWIFPASLALPLLWGPPVLFALIVYWLLSRPIYFLTAWGRRAVGVALTVTVLIAIPQWVQSHFETISRIQVSGDILEKPDPANPDILALISADGSGAKLSHLESCGDFCLRVLLNDVADGVALFSTELLPVSPNPSMRGKLYRLVEKLDCPQFRYSRANWIRVKGEPPGSRLRIEGLLKQALEDGRCVVSDEITLSQADMVVAAGLAKKGLKTSDAGFNLLADTVSVKRIQFYERTAGVLRETYRSTKATGQLPTSPLTLAFNMDDAGFGIRWKPGFLRREIELVHSGNTDLSKFLTTTLGLDLGM